MSDFEKKSNWRSRYEGLEVDGNDINWEDIVTEFGENSPEAVVAVDMMELEESVKPSEQLFDEACKNLDEIEESVEFATEYANQVFFEEDSAKNIKALAKNLSEEQIRDIVEKNPVVKDNSSLKETIGSSFDLSSSVDDQAFVIAQAERAKHPLRFTLYTLSQIPAQLKEARAIAENAGLDYRTSAEKVAKSVSTKTGEYYGGAKIAVTERLQSVAENSASIYKEACSNFADLVERAKENVKVAVAKITMCCDVFLDCATLGLWSNYCEHLESLAKDKGLREVGYVGDNTLEGKMLDMMDKDPNGLISNIEKKMFNKAKMFRQIVNNVEIVIENDGALFTKLHNKAISGLKQYERENYWNEVNASAFAEFGDKKNPADQLKALAKNIDEFGYKVDNKVGENIEQLCKKAKEVCTKAKEFFPNLVKKTKEFVTTQAEQIAEKASLMYASTKSGCFKMAAKTFEKSAAMVSKTTRKNEAMVNQLKTFDQNIFEKIQDIKKEINDLSSITPYQRKPYEMSDSVAKQIDILNQATPSAEISFAKSSIFAKEAANEKVHDIKESAVGIVKDSASKLGAFVKSSIAKAKMLEYEAAELAAKATICSATGAYESSLNTENKLNKIAEALSSKAESLVSSKEEEFEFTE